MRYGLGMFSVLAPVAVARADVMSGPKAGGKVEDFKACSAAGLFEGKEGSYVAERTDEPTVFVVIESIALSAVNETDARKAIEALKDRGDEEGEVSTAAAAPWASSAGWPPAHP